MDKPQNKKLIQLAASAVLTLLFINFYLKNKEQSISSGYNMVEVVATARDVPPHTLLTGNYLTTKRIPIRFMEPGAIMVKIPAQDMRRVIGKVSQVAIAAGSQITQSHIMDPSPNTTGVAPLVPPGKRGYLLRLGNLDVGELILPGDHIDIMATFNIRDKETNTRATYTILQNILVLSVGRELRKPNQDVSGKREGTEALMLTLALDPVESERMSLAHAESQGEISVVVRSHGDEDMRPVPGVNPGNLLAGPRMDAPPTPPVPAR